MRWLWWWARLSNDRAVVNARAATTALSRARVEREEVELYCRRRYGPVAEGRPVPARAGLTDVGVAVSRR